MKAVLGVTDDMSWQVGVVISRPGSPAGHWHSDGVTYRRKRGDSPCAVCVFVPLVSLELPRSESHGTRYGCGCTAFWPGSHLDPESLRLGPVGARLGAAVPGAPLRAGAALLYDYVTIHAALPNDASDDGEGERPILQFTFFARSNADRVRNYGKTNLFPVDSSTNQGRKRSCGEGTE